MIHKRVTIIIRGLCTPSLRIRMTSGLNGDGARVSLPASISRGNFRGGYGEVEWGAGTLLTLPVAGADLRAVWVALGTHLFLSQLVSTTHRVHLNGSSTFVWLEVVCCIPKILHVVSLSTLHKDQY